MEDLDIDTISFIKASRYRRKILQVLIDKILTPSEISKKIGIHFSYLSKLLSELSEKELILCLNDNSKKTRLYKITDIGLKNLKDLEKIE
ncbi:MAG: winged helix-turn-helix domain-containing protein [Promethearchaeota archaeon]